MGAIHRPEGNTESYAVRKDVEGQNLSGPWGNRLQAVLLFKFTAYSVNGAAKADRPTLGSCQHACATAQAWLRERTSRAQSRAIPSQGGRRPNIRTQQGGLASSRHTLTSITATTRQA